MKKLPGLTLASLLAACASEAPLPVASDVQAIVDGDDASAASFNMVARLERQLGWEDACSGVVLRNDVAEGVCYVLTVRHCVPTLAQERCKDAPRIARFSGTSTPWLWPAAPVGTVHSFLTSPDGEDLAMVKVNCSAFTPAIKGTAVPVTGEIGTIVGWGRTNGDVLPTKRRKAQVQLTPQPDGTVGFVGLDGSPDNGDSGGAIFVNRNGELRLAAIITTSVVLGLFGEGQIVPLGPPFAPGWIDQFMDRGGVHPDAMERCGFHPSGFTNLAEERLRSDCDKRYRENYCPASSACAEGGTPSTTAPSATSASPAAAWGTRSARRSSAAPVSSTTPPSPARRSA